MTNMEEYALEEERYYLSLLNQAPNEKRELLFTRLFRLRTKLSPSRFIEVWDRGYDIIDRKYPLRTSL